jgi:hypothetical protein
MINMPTRWKTDKKAGWSDSLEATKYNLVGNVVISGTYQTFSHPLTQTRTHTHTQTHKHTHTYTPRTHIPNDSYAKMRQTYRLDLIEYISTHTINKSAPTPD